jgi:copper(I)-binding protein
MEPGDMHIMLMKLTKKLVEGESFPLTLTFENTGEMTIDVPILGIAAKGPAQATQ